MMRYVFYVMMAFSLWNCSPSNVDVDNSLEKYFIDNKVEGTFAMFNNGNGIFTIYNLDRYKDSAFLPASTFKIVNSLIGLQTGIITNENMIIKWDSVERGVAEWNRDLSMYDAFRASSVPYYQEVARRIGKDTMQYWLDTLSYGSKKIRSAIDTFWLDNSLTISPDEQLGLVKKLYFNQLPFHQINHEIVKKAMLFENKPQYRLAYKTGWGTLGVNPKRNIGWVVGWIEENEHPYFFVLNLESSDKEFDMVTVRMKVLKEILAHLGFMKGNK